MIGIVGCAGGAAHGPHAAMTSLARPATSPTTEPRVILFGVGMLGLGYLAFLIWNTKYRGLAS